MLRHAFYLPQTCKEQYLTSLFFLVSHFNDVNKRFIYGMRNNGPTILAPIVLAKSKIHG